MIYAKESLGTTSAGFGILLASWGAGIVAGSMLFVARRDRSAAGLILSRPPRSASPTSGWPGAQSLFVACLLSVLGGTGNGIQWVSVMTALQEATPQRLPGARGRACSSRRCAAMPGVGYLIGGVLTAVGRRARPTPSPASARSCSVLVALIALRGLRLGHPARVPKTIDGAGRAPSAPAVRRAQVSLETGER